MEGDREFLVDEKYFVSILNSVFFTLFIFSISAYSRVYLTIVVVFLEDVFF